VTLYCEKGIFESAKTQSKDSEADLLNLKHSSMTSSTALTISELFSSQGIKPLVGKMPKTWSRKTNFSVEP
jgi:hypothetical protein